MQAAADDYASFTLERLAEVVHKILGGLAAHDDERVTLYTWELVQEVTHAVATQRGVMIDSGRTYVRQVQERAGVGSAWTRQHRLAAGLRTEPSPLSPALARGAAALRLYRQTAALLRPVLTPPDREVVDGAVARITAAGWI